MPSAVEIAAALSLPTPTPEQVRVIEAPLEGVYRVIAGAGSGKTETMAQRVLWLVANSLCLPMVSWVLLSLKRLPVSYLIA